MSELLNQRHLKHFMDRQGTPGTCVVCLDKINNEAFTDTCGHSFCFGCISRWSRENAICPLCKTKFKSIIHNVRSVAIYDVCDIDPSVNGVQSQATHNNVNTTLQTSVYATVVDEPQHSVLMNTTERGYFIVIPRTTIYRFNLFQAEPSVSNNGRLRGSSPTYYRQNPGELRRLIPWIVRDLRAIKTISEFLFNVNLVTNTITDMLQEHYIRGVHFYYVLCHYLECHTELFIEELYRFAISPCEMNVYETQVEYRPQTNGRVTQMEIVTRPPNPVNLELQETDTISIDDSDEDEVIEVVPSERNLDTAIIISDSEDETIADAAFSNSGNEGRIPNEEHSINETKRFGVTLKKRKNKKNHLAIQRIGESDTTQRIGGSNAMTLATRSDTMERASGSGFTERARDSRINLINLRTSRSNAVLSASGSNVTLRASMSNAVHSSSGFSVTGQAIGIHAVRSANETGGMEPTSRSYATMPTPIRINRSQMRGSMRSVSIIQGTAHGNENLPCETVSMTTRSRLAQNRTVTPANVPPGTSGERSNEPSTSRARFERSDEVLTDIGEATSSSNENGGRVLRSARTRKRTKRSLIQCYEYVPSLRRSERVFLRNA